jgi:hypothetical protein
MGNLNLITVMILLISIMSCSNTKPQPVTIYRQNDQELSCLDIENEVESILINNIGLKNEIKNKNKENLALYITGQIFILPTLGMDVTGSKEIEFNAYLIRLNRLKDLANMKDCKLERNS